jgi:non-ribosomal peptide synthetase component F
MTIVQATVVEHASICSSAKAHAPGLGGIDKSSRFLQFAAYTFDASVVEVLTVLMQGGCCCIPSEDERLNGIVSAIERECV